jgi:integrase
MVSASGDGGDLPVGRAGVGLDRAQDRLALAVRCGRRGEQRGRCALRRLPGGDHEQRHTFVSVLSDAGVDIEVVADAAGHISSSVTRTTYRHQIDDVVAGATVTMDEIFGKVSGS